MSTPSSHFASLQAAIRWFTMWETSLAAGERPGGAGWGDLTAHDQIGAVLVVVGGIEVVFGAVAVTLVASVQAGAGGEGAGEAAGVDHNGGAPLADAVAVIFGDD